MSNLTQERLKELLHYDPDSGIFTWRVRRRRVSAGSVAGHVGCRGYISIRVYYMDYLAHRLAFLYMTGAWPANEIDHINGNRSDNRWANLRDVTKTENLRNQRLHRNSTSGVVGVFWYKAISKWRAHIKVHGKQLHLGSFDAFDEACRARKAAEVKYGFHQNHGDRRIDPY